MSHQPSLGSSPKTNQGPEARSISKIWRWSHSSANKADLLFRAPAKAPAAPPAMCSYDRVLTFSQFTKDISLFFVLKGALPNGPNCQSAALDLPPPSSQSSKARTPIGHYFFPKHLSAPPNEPLLLLAHTLPTWVGNGHTPGDFHLIASDSGI